MSKVIEVTDQNFEEEVLKSDLPTEVDFWAPWCGPCQRVSPIYDKLSEEYEGKFKFCKINVDENQRTAGEHRISSIPAQMFFVGGKKVDEILGVVSEHAIRTMVEGIIHDFPTDDKGRLKMILSSWVEDNQRHSDIFGRWLGKSDNPEVTMAYNNVLQAAQQLAKDSKQLSQVLTEL